VVVEAAGDDFDRECQLTVEGWCFVEVSSVGWLALVEGRGRGRGCGCRCGSDSCDCGYGDAY